MSDFTISSPTVEHKVFRFSFMNNTFHSNCGINVVHSISLISKGDQSIRRDIWGSYIDATDAAKYNSFSVEEAFSALDSIKKQILASIPDKGFTILSDRLQHGKLHSKRNEQVNLFGVADFVHWLISRGIGYIVRSPVVMNKNHPGDSAICTWTWIRNPNVVIDCSTVQYGSEMGSAFQKKHHPYLYEIATKHIEDESLWSSKEIENDRSTKKVFEEIGVAAPAGGIASGIGMSGVPRRKVKREVLKPDTKGESRRSSVLVPQGQL